MRHRRDIDLRLINIVWVFIVVVFVVVVFVVVVFVVVVFVVVVFGTNSTCLLQLTIPASLSCILKKGFRNGKHARELVCRDLLV